jgi:hypothetical protein
VPEYNCTTASIVDEGSTVIVAVVFTAVKLYQTSSSAVPEQPTNDCVAPIVVPAVFEQTVFTNKLTALLQISFAGAGGGLVTQIVKVLEPEPVP